MPSVKPKSEPEKNFIEHIDSALLEAQQQAEIDSARFDFDGVSAKLRKKLANKASKFHY